MEIEAKSNMVVFSSIDQGTVFECSGRFYYKIEEVYIDIDVPFPVNAVNLSNGCLTGFKLYDLVRPIKGKFVEE